MHLKVLNKRAKSRFSNLNRSFFSRREFSIVVVWCAFAAPAYAQGDGSPFVHLYDTRSHAAESWSGASVVERDGWELLPEDETEAAILGDVVLTNDRLAVVVRKQGHGGEVYAFGEDGATKRVVLCPNAEETAWRVKSVQIRENTKESGCVEVAFTRNETSGLTVPTECAMSFALQIGQVFVQTEPVRDVRGLEIVAPADYAVIPDFFADDIVIGGGDISAASAELPGDNFLLEMLGKGDSIVLCVSKNRERDFGITLGGEGDTRGIERATLEYGEAGVIWIAVLEGTNVWTEYTVARRDAGKTIDLEWQAPFPAQWRVDWRLDDGFTDSWEMLLQRADGTYEKHGWLGTPEAVGTADWLRNDGQRWTTVLGWFRYPCWIDNQLNAYLLPLEKNVVCFEGPVLIYPIDRVRSTPLERFTVVDIVRATLGVGPCEYILDLEGQQLQFRGMATCAARDVIKPIVAEGKQNEKREEIERALTNALAFVKHIRGRIEEYRAFGREMTAYVEEKRAAHPELAAFLEEMKSLTAEIESYFEKRRDEIRSPSDVEEMMHGFRKTLDDVRGQAAIARCKEFTRALTDIGANQDELVGECRVAVKRLRQRAGLASADFPEAADIASEIREKTQDILRNPASYEAPRH